MDNPQKKLTKLKSELAARFFEEKFRNGKSVAETKRLGKQLVEELVKIPGWEYMVLSCYYHLKKYKDPMWFFDDCTYEFEDPADREEGKVKKKNILYVKKYYWDDNPEGYVVLELDLDSSLEKQVSDKIAEIEQVKIKKLEEEWLKDMAVLDSLDIPAMTFAEWKTRKKKEKEATP